MFTLKDYAGPHAAAPDWNAERQANAQRLILACAKLQDELQDAGIHFQLNPRTGTTISGETFGGFRPQSCPIGAHDSAHKTGEAVDRYDPDCSIDDYLMTHQEMLAECGIYIEHPSATHGWSHWSVRAPASGHHVFVP